METEEHVKWHEENAVDLKNLDNENSTGQVAWFLKHINRNKREKIKYISRTFKSGSDIDQINYCN